MGEESLFLSDLLSIGQSSISIRDFVINLILTAVLTYFLGIFYIRFGSSLSNRKALAINFLMVGITTMVIISIVKSSLALSLGLVGALSIVRFRTAIKEPEELAFFFMSIAIGLGLGADQRLITTIGIVLIVVIVFLAKLKKHKDVIQNLIITITPTKEVNDVDIKSIIESIGVHSKNMEIKRMEENVGITEMAFNVEFSSLDQLLKVKDSLNQYKGAVQFSFIENK